MSQIDDFKETKRSLEANLEEMENLLEKIDYEHDFKKLS
jgi:hypothetical protein